MILKEFIIFPGFGNWLRTGNDPMSDSNLRVANSNRIGVFVLGLLMVQGSEH